MISPYPYGILELWNCFGNKCGGYVSLDDMFLLAMLDDVFLPCLMYRHILPNCCFIFQIFKMLLNFRFLFSKKKKDKNRKRVKLNK